MPNHIQVTPKAHKYDVMSCDPAYLDPTPRPGWYISNTKPHWVRRCRGSRWGGSAHWVWIWLELIAPPTRAHWHCQTKTLQTPRRIRILIASSNRHNDHGKHVEPHKLDTHTRQYTLAAPLALGLLVCIPDLQYIGHSRKADGMPYNGNLNNGHGHMHIIGRLRVDLLKLLLVQQQQHFHTVHNAPNRVLNNWSTTC
jgi:hypothetical protein